MNSFESVNESNRFQRFWITLTHEIHLEKLSFLKIKKLSCFLREKNLFRLQHHLLLQKNQLKL